MTVIAIPNILREKFGDTVSQAFIDLFNQVEERAKVIADLEQGLQRLKILGDPQSASPDADVILASIMAQEEKLKSASAFVEPIILVAPIEGMVNAVYRQAGENVGNGEPILALSAAKPDHIVGYLRQPFMREAVGFDRYPGKRLLEIGCGLGTDTLQFARGGPLSPAST